MSAAHTPGLWEVQEPMDHELWIVEAGKEAYEWRVIAGLPWPEEKSDIPRKQVEANARLIAAAPDLLAALLTILGPLKVARNNPNVRDDECLPVDMTMGELRQAWTAIAKATGQEGGAL